MPRDLEGKPATYLNPVYPHSFPDPFVLKFRGEYFAYCTGDAPDGNVFGVLRSPNLVDWTYVGSGMEPLGSRPPYYWAPEVIYDNGKFYCYYSAGNEILMEIRVAVSDRPDGGFVDAGVRLTKEEFAIDAHVFIDEDGTRYLFYATDFLEHSHIGTGTVVDRMLDWKTIEGNPCPVTRAKYDWQVYDPARKEKGGVRWHTVEGPSVIKRKGKYYEMFSGGNWQNMTYGVSFAMTSSMNFSDEWQQFSDGEKILPILRTIPEKVVGPGHNSVVRGPNNRELYCVYHRWTDAGRVLAIDRMDFAGDRMFVAGPTTTPQFAPFEPASLDGLVIDSNGWLVGNSEFISSPATRSELTLNARDSFLFETTFRFLDAVSDGSFGFELGDGIKFIVSPSQKSATLSGGNADTQTIGLSADFDPNAFHLLRLEVGLERLQVTIDNAGQSAKVPFTGIDGNLKIIADVAQVSFSVLELTRGFEELFESDTVPNGLVTTGDAKCQAGQLTVTPSAGERAEVALEVPYDTFEIAANLASVDATADGFGMAFYSDDRQTAGSLSAAIQQKSIEFSIADQKVEIDLPEAFVGNEFRQFRILCHDKAASAYLDGILLGELPLTANVSGATVFGNSAIVVEMLRLTEI